MAGVTPLVGVWIEIVWNILKYLQSQSLPLWECGLKFYKFVIIAEQCKVTPLVGVWIEISVCCSYMFSLFVTPLVGVWIEISIASAVSIAICVTPLVGVWIEILLPISGLPAEQCHSPCGSVD